MIDNPRVRGLVRIADDLGFVSAQVASNRWAKIIEHAMPSPQVLRRMPDDYAWVFIEAVGLVRGRPGSKGLMARRLVAGAAHYVHRADEVRHDFDDPNGLDDDWPVVRSVCRARELDFPDPGFTRPIRISCSLP